MKSLYTLAAAIAAVALSGTAFAGSAEDVIAAEKCTKCHTATTTKKGPSYASVAAKYKGKADAATVLFKGLKAGGKMVIPAGLPDSQQLILVEKDASGTVSTREILPVRFSLLEQVEAG